MIAHLRRVARRAQRRGDGGAAAVEFALVLPVVVIVLFGTLMSGLVLYDHLQLQSAARDGARAGALVAGGGCDVALDRVVSTPGGATTCSETTTCPGTRSSLALTTTRSFAIPLLGERSVTLASDAAFDCLV